MKKKKKLKACDEVSKLARTYIWSQVNPERHGCPSFQQLEEFLLGYLVTEEIDQFYEHLASCRECLLELKMLLSIT